MEKIDLTVSIEKLKLDALTYALSEKGGDTPQKVLEQRFKAFYEETVPPDLRGYVDYMIAAQTPRSHAKKPAKPAAAAQKKEAEREERTEEKQDG